MLCRHGLSKPMKRNVYSQVRGISIVDRFSLAGGDAQGGSGTLLGLLEPSTSICSYLRAGVLA